MSLRKGKYSKQIPVGPVSQSMECPSCHAQILTVVRHQPNTETHLIAILLCCFLCWPCICVPYFVNSCQNTNHYCPNCKAFIGTYT